MYLLIVLTRVYAGSSSLTCKNCPLAVFAPPVQVSIDRGPAREDHPLPSPDKLADTGGDKCEN